MKQHNVSGESGDSKCIRPGLKVIKLEFILRLKIKRNDWLLADMCPQAANHCALCVRKQPIIALYFDSETVLMFYNLEASKWCNSEKCVHLHIQAYTTSIKNSLTVSYLLFLSNEEVMKYIYSTKKTLGNLKKNMEQTNTKANNYSIIIYLFRYIPSVKKDASFSLLALIPLLWHCVK